ncbi:putative DNA helicase ino80 [Tetrabaena socialis]|uniref:Putative DNA helicase ino80 n=1 Tax=Tetrabaena socialis TaxID=47790 RepID=A0A2J8A778_9CHLO|nr:putative DNA helicase ino80 [Tetrabaena socialis]|eukprot:PNH08384.1 putative DNA helicase ino80 [Tetrabaena socialis]
MITTMNGIAVVWLAFLYLLRASSGTGVELTHEYAVAVERTGNRRFFNAYSLLEKTGRGSTGLHRLKAWAQFSQASFEWNITKLRSSGALITSKLFVAGGVVCQAGPRQRQQKAAAAAPAPAPAPAPVSAPAVPAPGPDPTAPAPPDPAPGVRGAAVPRPHTPPPLDTLRQPAAGSEGAAPSGSAGSARPSGPASPATASPRSEEEARTAAAHTAGAAASASVAAWARASAPSLAAAALAAAAAVEAPAPQRAGGCPPPPAATAAAAAAAAAPLRRFPAQPWSLEVLAELAGEKAGRGLGGGGRGGCLDAGGLLLPLPLPLAAARDFACLLCLEGPRQHGFLHGGTVHVGVCADCAGRLTCGQGAGGAAGGGGAGASPLSCPVCRQPADRMVEVVL